MDPFKIMNVCILSSITSSIITHPIDVLKVRLQSTPYSITHTQFISNIIKREGISFLYKGLSASFLRNASFVSSKMFAYNCLKESFITDRFHEKLICGMSAGVVGSIIGTPFDNVMVKMQNNPTLYSTITKTVKQTFLNKGIKDFWKGVEYTSTRAIVVTSCQFSVYEQIKQELTANKTMKNSNLIFVYSSISSSIITSLFSNPLDVCKNRAINNIENTSIFSIVQKEGVSALWKGVSLNVARQIPLNLLRFSFFEFYMNLFRKDLEFGY